ncbi:hypothetical protein EPN29_02840 [bacterium]|nr:MAG: hypothetical protein EPN29_02840 [bacterium]
MRDTRKRAPRWLTNPGLRVVILVYVAIALGVTFPFILDPSHTLTAPLHADVASSVSKFQALVREQQNPFFPSHLSSIGWPNGVTLDPTVDRVAWLNTLYLWISTLLLGSIATHSLLYFLGMVVTAVVTCLFVRRVTGSLAAGFIAGLAFGFFPHLYLMGWAAPTYTWMWMILLPIWGFYNLALTPSVRNGTIAGLTPLPAMFWTPYFALHALLVAFACGVVLAASTIMLRDVGGRRLLQFAPAVIIPACGLAVYVLIGALSHFGGVPTRSVEDAFQESAQPLMFVIPGWHSVWGNGPDDFLVRHVPRARYANLYVGYTVMALGLVALATTARTLRQQRTTALRSGLVLATLMAATVVAICFLFSLPPRLAFHAHSIPMPDDIVIHVQPAFRAGQRLVMPLMGGMAVLAGLGVSVILKKVPRRGVPVFILVVASLVWIDLFARPPEAVNRLPQSPALAALRTQPPGPVFQYIPSPLALGRFPSVRSCLLQPQYDKPLADTCELAQQSEDYERWLAHPDCTTLAEIRQFGVRYVIVDDSLTNLLRCMQTDLAGQNRRVADDGRLSVYQFT